MSNKSDFIDRALIKLNRQFSKDELVLTLKKELKEKSTLIGSLNSEIAHLEYELSDHSIEKKARFEAKKELYKDSSFNSLRGEVSALRIRLKEEQKKNEKLVTEIVKLRKR